MSSKLKEICISYQTKPLDTECYKRLGIMLNQCSPAEREQFFETFHPKEHHLQNLKVVAANLSGSHATILHGLNEESKVLSKFCSGSKLLFNSTSHMYDPEFVIPLLQSVSHSTRNRIIWNLGKYMAPSSSNIADVLYNRIAKVWGTNVASPLLCKASEELIRHEMMDVHTQSKFQLVTIAKRFPYVALDLIEKTSVHSHQMKAIRYIVRATIPKSFDYCLKQNDTQLLSKSANKIILQNYRHIVLEAPSKWANVLNKKCVKNMLTAEEFQLFVTKQFDNVGIIISTFYLPTELKSYFKLLLPNQISQVLTDAFKIKYGCPYDSKLEFWEENKDLLELLNPHERSNISAQLDLKNEGDEWVPLMTCDKSIPRLKEKLQSETDAHVRARLVSKLLTTVSINNNLSELEEVCQFVSVRYRNDREVLQAFFNSIPDLSSVSPKTWSLVTGVASKFYSPGDYYSNGTVGTLKFFATAIKRDGESGLKRYLEICMAYYNVNIEPLNDLSEDLRVTCINNIFTEENVESMDAGIQSNVTQFLSLLSTWNAKSLKPIVCTNVTAFILNVFKTFKCFHISDYVENVVNFILNKKNGIDVKFIEKCIEQSPEPHHRLLQYLLSRHSPILNTDDTATKIANHLIDVNLFRNGYVSLLKKMKKGGYVNLLQCLATQSKAAIADPNRINFQHAVFLNSLTSGDSGDYFSIIEPFFCNPDNSENILSPFSPEASEDDVQPEKIKEAKRRESIYKGIGWSFSHIDLPAVTIDILLKFCVNGDLMLFVRDSLHSVVSSVPNAMAQKMILSLIQRPVSVKKHALRLHHRVCNIQTQQELLLHLIEVEHHITTRTVLLQYAIDCLNNTKLVSMWLVVKEMMVRLTPQDRSIVVILADAVVKVPDPFVEEYLQLLLEKSTLLKDVNIAFISKIIQLISSHTNVISEQFKEKIIQEYFCSDVFSEDMYSHQVVSSIFVNYLKGIAPSQTLGRNLMVSNLSHRQDYLKIRLDCTTSGILLSAQNLLSKNVTRSMLVQFIELFCSNCLSKKSTDSTDLILYTDILIEFLEKFDQNLMFHPFVFISLTQLFLRSPDVATNTETHCTVLGQMIAKFCDSIFLKNPELSRYILPSLVQKFFETFCGVMNDNVRSKLYTEILLAPALDNTSLLLRVMILARILPINWQKNVEFESFRQTFLPLVKKTPAEAFMFQEGVGY